MADKNPYSHIGQRIHTYRKKLGLTQRQIADYLNVDQALISKIENGERNITVSMLERLCDLFFCSIDDIVSPNNAHLNGMQRTSIAFRAQKIDSSSLAPLAAVGRVVRNLDKMTRLEEATRND